MNGLLCQCSAGGNLSNKDVDRRVREDVDRPVRAGRIWELRRDWTCRPSQRPKMPPYPEGTHWVSIKFRTLRSEIASFHMVQNRGSASLFSKIRPTSDRRPSHQLVAPAAVRSSTPHASMPSLAWRAWLPWGAAEEMALADSSAAGRRDAAPAHGEGTRAVSDLGHAPRSHTHRQVHRQPQPSSRDACVSQR